jgi:hypothetical protein
MGSLRLFLPSAIGRFRPSTFSGRARNEEGNRRVTRLPSAHPGRKTRILSRFATHFVDFCTPFRAQNRVIVTRANRHNTQSQPDRNLQSSIKTKDRPRLPTIPAMFRTKPAIPRRSPTIAHKHRPSPARRHFFVPSSLRADNSSINKPACVANSAVQAR